MTRAGDRYDVIGHSYARTRREDPYIAREIHSAVGAEGSIVNIGAGSGNYEPIDRNVVAVEPSQQMIDQRVGRSAPVVQGVAEFLPFPEDSFDVAMALLTVHHWTNPAAGLREMARVADRQVLLFFEPLPTHDFWALDSFPAALSLPTELNPPGERMLTENLGLRAVVRFSYPATVSTASASPSGPARRPTSTRTSSLGCPGWRCSWTPSDSGAPLVSSPISISASGTVGTVICAKRSSSTVATASRWPHSR